jgi:hypothetical protein
VVGAGAGSLRWGPSWQLIPKHDHLAPDAVVLQAPAPGTPGVHVVLDPFLSSRLRPHQKAGVQFMWNCGELPAWLAFPTLTAHPPPPPPLSPPMPSFCMYLFSLALFEQSWASVTPPHVAASWQTKWALVSPPNPQPPNPSPSPSALLLPLTLSTPCVCVALALRPPPRVNPCVNPRVCVWAGSLLQGKPCPRSPCAGPCASKGACGPCVVTVQPLVPSAGGSGPARVHVCPTIGVTRCVIFVCGCCVWMCACVRMCVCVSVAGVPAAGKIAIVTPSGLVGNWRSEFNRWLGRQRIDPCVVNCVGKVRTMQARGA